MPVPFRLTSRLWLRLLGSPVPAGAALLLVGLAARPALAQETPPARVLVTGTVRDAAGRALEQVVVGVEGMPGGTSTDERGRFTLSVVRPLSGKAPVLALRRLGYRTERISLNLDQPRELELTLQEDSRALGQRDGAGPHRCHRYPRAGEHSAT